VVRVGEGVDVLARLSDEHGDDIPVLMRRGNVLASSFHPELTGDRRVHQLFVSMVEAASG
jgi:5'-phosphate synthase pdxT subunit